MPKRIKNTEHGTLTFVDQATLTFEDRRGNRQEATMEITRFNGPDSFLTFFGEAELLRLIGERPHPPDYFKVFRAERYKDEIRFLASAIPAHTEEWKEIKRDVFRGFHAQIAMEVSRLFPQTEEFAKRWLENKMHSQRCPHEFEHVWNAYRGWPMPMTMRDEEVIFSTIYFRNIHCLKWLSLRGVMCNEADTVYDFVGCTIMNGSSKIEETPLPCRLKATGPRPLIVPISEFPTESKAN